MADDEARAEDAAVHAHGADRVQDVAGVEEAGTGGGDPLGDDPRSMWQRLRAGDLHRAAPHTGNGVAGGLQRHRRP